MPTRGLDRRDVLAMATLSAGLLAWFAAPGIVRGFGFPVGPDAPVYLWWTRLAGVDGLSAITRPGVPALALVLSGTLRAPVSAVLAAIEIAGGVLTGISGAALVRLVRPDDRATWTLAGALAGTFAVHVATGYLATLVFGVVFLAAAAAIATRTRRGAAVAAALLGAAAIAHPRFLALGAAILGLAAVLAWREDRAEARRLLTAVVGGAAILGLAALALLVGPSPLLADTSRDAFLRRVGLDDILRRAYLTRFTTRWSRYAPWGSVPLAGLAWVPTRARPRTTVDRILVAWVAVAAGGAIVAAATGLAPVDRFLTFAFAIPLSAAIGATRLARSPLIPRAIARIAASVLVGTMVLGAGSTWLAQRPFIDGRDLAALRTVNAVTVAAPRTAIVVPVRSERSAFLLTLWGNAVRATVPPDRIRDVVVTVIASAPGREAAAIAARTAADERAAIGGHGGRAQRILVVPFTRGGRPGAPWTPIDEDVAVDPVPAAEAPVSPDSAVDPVEPFTPWLPALLALVIVALLGAIGWSWATIGGLTEVLDVASLAPGVGIGILILVASALERLGVPLTGIAGPLAVSAVGVGCGPLVRGVVRRGLAGRAGIPRDGEARP